MGLLCVAWASSQCGGWAPMVSVPTVREPGPDVTWITSTTFYPQKWPPHWYRLRGGETDSTYGWRHGKVLKNYLRDQRWLLQLICKLVSATLKRVISITCLLPTPATFQGTLYLFYWSAIFHPCCSSKYRLQNLSQLSGKWGHIMRTWWASERH